MKKFLSFILLITVVVLTLCPEIRAEDIFSYIDSGSDYSSSRPLDDGDTVEFFDNATGITAEINKQFLDKAAYDSLRKYYNDPSLSEKELFARFTDLKKSYIDALEAVYNTNYMDPDKENTETAMRIYYQGTETLYGLDNCSTWLYNIVKYEGLACSESVHLDMVIPNLAGNTVITIKFTIPKDKLGEAVSGTVSSMLSSFQFNGMPTQAKAPQVFSNKAVVAKVQLGIYPAASQKKPEYTDFEDTAAGFKVSVPTTYVPYIQNSLGGVFTYTSFKIDPNRIFSISSEPLQGSGMADALTRFKVTSFGSVKVLENSTKAFNGKDFSYLYYVTTNSTSKKYFQDYYLQTGSRLYKMQLQSTLAESGDIVNEQVSKILASFCLTGTPAQSTDSTTKSDTLAPVKYVNSDEGYSFTYPKNWRLEDVSSDIAYDRLRLIIPGLSGALDVSVQESELNQIVTFTDIVKNVNGETVTSWPKLAVNYNPPFDGKISKLLYSDFSIDGAVSTIYRQSVFMDENGRNRLCYSVDIINGRKLYSMFITAAEYRTGSGRFEDSRVNDLINMVAASFRLEKTPESEARRIAGESRNRKLVFVENYLKQVVDPKITILSVDKLQSDGTFYVTTGNAGQNGFYKIRLDYPNRNVTILDSVLKRDILSTELARLKGLYSSKILIRAAQNESNMTLTIETRENAASENLIRTFRVDAHTDGSKVVWQTVRLAHQEDYMWECEAFIKSMLSDDSKVYYESGNVFKDMEPYKNKGVSYRFMTYVDSSRISGFAVLSMDPRSSLITAEGGLIPLDYVVKAIMKEYGIKYLSNKSDAVSFNPETFILKLRTADRNGNDTITEQYKIQYNLDNRTLEYHFLH